MAVLYCLTNDELKEYLGLEKDFQSKIVFQALNKGITDWNAMTSLPKAIRERISKDHPSALSSKAVSYTHLTLPTKISV